MQSNIKCVTFYIPKTPRLGWLLDVDSLRALHLFLVAKIDLTYLPGVDAASDSFGDLLRKPQGHFEVTFRPLWSFLFPQMMTRQIKGDALKKTLNGEPSSSLTSLFLLPSYAHLTSELPPSFIHANLSLSRRIYILRCRAKFPVYLCWVHRK